MGAIISLLIIVLVYGAIMKKAIRTAEKNKAKPAARPAAKPVTDIPVMEAAPPETDPVAHAEKQKQLEAVFGAQPPQKTWGSMEVETGEGEDTAHGDGFHGSATYAFDEAPEEAPEEPLLSFEGGEVVRGFVMGEILRRRTPSGTGREG